MTGITPAQGQRIDAVTTELLDHLQAEATIVSISALSVALATIIARQVPERGARDFFVDKVLHLIRTTTALEAKRRLKQ